VGLAKLIRSDFRKLIKILSTVKVRSWQPVIASFAWHRLSNEPCLVVYVGGLSAPIHLRYGTSDFEVFSQVFLDRQYDFPINGPVNLIVDAGANIGLASVFFLDKYRDATIIALEPEFENFKMAQKNLQHFHGRFILLNSAIWSEDATLAVSNDFRDGREWSYCTSPVSAHDECRAAIVPAISIETLMSRYRVDRIDLFKIDIEGAEVNVLRDGNLDFFGKTRCCAVECHDSIAEALFASLAHRHGRRVFHRQELTISIDA
jgi:FkbM family methyltransferase